MRPDAARPKQGMIEAVILIATSLFLFLLLFRLPFDPFFLESDQLIFLYNADRMLGGESIYRDFFQFTFPGGQVLYFFLLSIFGTHFWVLPLAIIAMGTTYAWVLLRLSSRLISAPISYLPALIFIFFGFRWFGLDGSHRMFSPLFILFAVLVLLRGTSLPNLLFAGIFCAIASSFTQQRGIVAIAALGSFVLAECYVNSTYFGEALKRISILIASFIVSLSVLVGYFIYTAGPETFFFSTFVFPSLYYHFHEENNLGAFWVGFRGLLANSGLGPRLALTAAIFYGVAIPLTLLVFGLTVFRERKGFEWNYWRGAVLLGFVGAFAIFSTSNPSHLRFFQLSGPILVLLAWMLHHYKVFEKGRSIVVPITAAILVALSVTQAVRQQTNAEMVRIEAPRGTVYAPRLDQTNRYLWIQERTEPGDKVFETTNPYIYFLFELKNPSRYTQVFDTELTRPEFIAWTVEDLSNDPPKFILWNNQYNRPDDEREPGDHTGPLAMFVNNYYRPASPIYQVDGKPIQIWERIVDR
jgi:hypothetical protein